MIAMWTSRHDDLASDDVVAPHVFDPMVVPACGVVLTRCNSRGSAVDAGLDAAARVLNRATQHSYTGSARKRVIAVCLRH
jgi:hypothetical protein